MSGQSAGLSAFQTRYEVSPILLVNGIATNFPGGVLPVVLLTQPTAFSGGPTSQASPNMQFQARFRPMPNSTLMENQNGKYPYANQQVAANAIIVQPLRISLLMEAPAPMPGGYTAKLANITSLKKTLDSHVQQGGMFTVATPSYIYINCLLLTVRDVTGVDARQVQETWQWDFEQPLVTVAAAVAAAGQLNSLMGNITNGTMVTGDPPSQSGLAGTAGNPASQVGPVIVPSASGSVAASVGGTPPSSPSG